MNQHLVHGKALCGKVFAFFVETFNWLVDFASNLKGDADVNCGEGSIKVDRSDPAHPVIRYVGKSDQFLDLVSVHELTVTDQNGEEQTYKVMASDDIAVGGVCVRSVNSATGDVSIIGGENIEVSSSGGTIMISYAEGKEPDEDPNAVGGQSDASGPGYDPSNPCAHDKSGGAGGVAVGIDGEDDAVEDAGGGVPADGEAHSGDKNCNSGC